MTQALISSCQGMTARISGGKIEAAGSCVCPQQSTKYDFIRGIAVTPRSLSLPSSWRNPTSAWPGQQDINLPFGASQNCPSLSPDRPGNACSAGGSRPDPDAPAGRRLWLRYNRGCLSQLKA